jgi:hypothetical protein
MSTLADKIAQTLTELVTRDPLAATEFLTTRYETNAAMLEHPGLVFMAYAGRRLPLLSVLGLLNGLLAETGEYVLLDREENGRPYARVITQETEPKLFATATTIPAERLPAVIKHTVVTHGKLVCVRRYVRDENGQIQPQQSFDLLSEDDPLAVQTRELARQNPERLAFGLSLVGSDGETQVYTDLLPERELPEAAPPEAPAPAEE